MQDVSDGVLSTFDPAFFGLAPETLVPSNSTASVGGPIEDFLALYGLTGCFPDLGTTIDPCFASAELSDLPLLPPPPPEAEYPEITPFPTRGGRGKYSPYYASPSAKRL
ncbi:hypothetical protein B0H10DRAFT_2235510 [Mycena sp. CBHHK59/15]|nr:hypothetical protein B0H10DRAFT_2235510 [Mycena sp. CBHHK59/15]